jgi:3-methylfumaryl-CoA hydratase
MTGDLDIAALRAWIGRTETSVDTLTPRLAREYAAMLDRDPGEEFAPLAIHWCLAPPAAPAAALGPDGHPARGLFLPPVPLPRRMWAGGELRLHGRLRVGDLVTRTSRIADVTVKQGRAGILCFVTVEHELTGPRGLAISETQDIVYRDLETAAVPVPGAAPARRAVPREAGWRRDKGADAVLLFRYSALTFNGHRIHYDRAYAVGVEAYPGLVVHGPLQATWLLEYAAEIFGRTPKKFKFRGVSPLFDFDRFSLCARQVETGLELWTEVDGAPCMEASAQL